MSFPLMPKATALWLIDNTTLTFQQIADFCGLHVLEIQTIADGESNAPVVPFNPITNQQLTLKEIEHCQSDPDRSLNILVDKDPLPQRKKTKKYTPVAKRSERPDAIAWFFRHHPELDDKAIIRLIGTTKATLESVRDRSHRNSALIKPRCPITMGLCTQHDVDEAVSEAQQQRKAAHKDSD